ncbi:MAG: HD domain-containing protein [Betaproteobacteria bacterium]|jgi:phosphonate degradation associated HDIG domain protein|nr:HD domain-containing protein [Betaproteobacteria bacterium]
MNSKIAPVIDLYELKGQLQYQGEAVTQIEHAWQCGQLAKSQGASRQLQLAAWLHDIGHLLSKLEGSPTISGKDDRHELIGSKYLSSIFPEIVYKSIELHVDAKRFLVSTEPAYRDQLSVDSIRSLQLQGGIMTMDECHNFLSKPYAAESIQLRRWDDLGKKSDCKMPELDEVIYELEELALGSA